MRLIVLDTNVFVSGLRSRLGASHKLLSLVGTGVFELVLSVPLILEYEDAATRPNQQLVFSRAELTEILDHLCSVARQQPIYYLWRPLLPDPKDDLVLEAAVAGACDTIVTFNLRHFRGVARFSIRVQTPGQFLQELGGSG
ncbi:MAG: putative toxin-antitoxin system toxin component, PIN family [Gemmatimonadetes bacterium]|nr:putative toxin-antitoxin system toxin component, PIN family [Gemmatimonadota bacterium]